MKLILVALVLLASSTLLRAQLIDPVLSCGLDSTPPFMPGQSFTVDAEVSGTRYDATHDHTYTVYVYFSTTSNVVSSPSAVSLGTIQALLPGNSTSGSISKGTFTVPTTFNGAATTAGNYYIVFQVSGTQSTATKSLSFQVVIADISVEQPAGTPLTDGVSTVSFGNVPVNPSIGAVLTFTVRNTGSATLTPLAANITGTNAADYSMDNALPNQLASGTTGLAVRFKPTASGTRTAILHVTSNAPGAKSSFDINLTGTGVVLPAVTSSAATNITRTGATLSGVVNANGGSVSVDFYYGVDGAHLTRVNATPATVSGNTDTPVSVTITGLNPDTSYVFDVEAVKSGLTTSGAGRSFVTAANNFDTWRQKYFPGSTSTTGPGADQAAPLGDDIPNIIKFATGLDPTKPATPPGSIQRQGGNLLFTFTPNPDAVADGLVFTVENCDDLSANIWQGTPLGAATLGSGGSPVTVTVPPGANGRAFARLRASEP